MLPNVIFQLIPILRGRNPSAFWSFIFSLTLNCGYGFYFSNFFIYRDTAYILIGIAATFTIIPYSMCCCSASFQSNHLAFREIMSKPLTKNQFIREMCGNRALSPLITVHCEAYHYETRTVHSGKKTSTRREKVVTFRSKRALPYQTWEEKGNSIRLKETDVIHAVCVPKYKLDESAKSELSNLRHIMYRLALSHDRYASVSNTFETPGLKESVVGTLSEDKDCVLSWYQTGLGRFFWVIFTIIGYQSAYESIWNQKGERMRLRLKKAISMGGHYRCRAGQEDEFAAKDTFRFDDVQVVIDPTLLTHFYQGPVISQDLYSPYPDAPYFPPPPNMGYIPPSQNPQQPYPQQSYPRQPYPQQPYPQQPYPQQPYPQQPYPQQPYPQQHYPQQPYTVSNEENIKPNDNGYPGT